MTTNEATRVIAVEKLALNIHEVCEITGMGRRTVEKLVSMGEFPKPHRIRCTTLQRWDVSEVRAWFEAQPRQGDPERGA